MFPVIDAALQVQLLGGFAVRANGVLIPEAQWRSRRARSLVKLLALAPDHRLHRDRVLDALWPDSDLTAAANNLHQTLFTARKIFEAAGVCALILQDSLLSLGDGLSVDVEQFEAAVAQTANSQDPALFQAALELYPGDLLPVDLYEEWTVARRDSLRQLHIKLLLDFARLLETRKEYSAGIETLGQVLAIDRAHEEAHAGLMRLYALSGQRQQALRQFQTLKEALRTELEAEPSPASLRLYEEIQSGRLPQTTALISAGTNLRKHNLPAQLTSFIGRETEIADLSEKVKSSRLVTLTGAGGTGKTRLALQVAEKVLDTFPDGVWLVELAPLSDPGLVQQACLQVLELVQQPGVSPTSILAHFLENKHALLILDNCEHLLAACTSLVNDLVKVCPQLHILASSREILSVPGESPFRVPSLAFPDPRSLPTPAELVQFEAVQLFEVRSKQASAGFHLAPEDTRTVAQICSRLDGIPLAIELAAARMHVLTVDQLASRLDNAFRVLTGGSQAVMPRQQTLKATIDWSYDLLASQERLLLQRLAVFAGGWTLEAAEVVTPDQEGTENCNSSTLTSLEVMDLIAALVDKSLVIAEIFPDGYRYRLLETIRQYARDRLLESGCGGAVRDRHLNYFSRLSGDAEPHLRGKGQVEWLERMDQELDNLRAALEWSVSSRIDLGLKIAADLMWFWHLRGLFTEAFEWLEKLLAFEAQQPEVQFLARERALQRARGLRAIAHQTDYVNIKNIPEQIALFQESVTILRTLEPLPRQELGISLYYLLLKKNILDQHSETHEEMLDIFQQENMKFWLSEYLCNTTFFADDLDQAMIRGKESLSIAREIEDLDGICGRSATLAQLMILKGDYLQAESLINEAIAICSKVKNYWLGATLIAYLSSLALAQGNYQEATDRAKEAITKFRELSYNPQIGGPLETLQQTAWSQGKCEESIQYALELISSSDGQWVARDTNLYLGRVAISQGDLSQAGVYMKKAISSNLWKGIMNAWNIAIPHLLGWIALFCIQGKYKASAQLIGAVDSFYHQIAPGLVPRERSEYEEDRASIRTVLSEEAFAEAFAAGQAMTLEQAITWVAEEMHVSRD